MANDSGFSEYDFDDSDLDDNEVVQAQPNPTNNTDVMPSLAEVGMSLAVAIHDLTETLHKIFPQSAPRADCGGTHSRRNPGGQDGRLTPMSRFVVRMLLRPVTEQTVESDKSAIDVAYLYQIACVRHESGMTFLEVIQDEQEPIIYMMITERVGGVIAIACETVTREEAIKLINHSGFNN